jgi:hypothetical protein
VPNTTIRYEARDHSFHIWSTSQSGAKFLKDFLTKRISISHDKLRLCPSSTIQDYLHEAKNIENQLGVGVILYESNLYILGTGKNLKKAKNVLMDLIPQLDE